MRTLTHQQKKELSRTLKTNPIIYDWESLPWETCEKLMDLNDTEVLPQEVDRFINDYRIKQNETN